MKSLCLVALLTASAAVAAHRVDIDRLEWVGLEKDRVRLAVHVRIDTPERAAIRNLRFQRMSIAGMPFYLSPPAGRIEIEPGRVEALPVTVFLRDLATLKALREAVDANAAAIAGEARFDVELPLLARIVLFSATAPVAAPIANAVPMHVPGGEFGRRAALAALDAAAKAEGLLEQIQWRSRTGRYQQSVVAIETSYTLDWRNGTAQTKAFRSVGYVLEPGRIVTPGETAEPWKYDIGVAAAIASGAASLRPDSIRVQGPGGPLRVIRASSEMDWAFVTQGDGKPIRVQIAQRASDNNLAHLESAAVDAAPIARAVDPAERWETVDIVRLSPHPRVFTVGARRQNGRIVFTDPMDERAIGSPVFSPAGAIGMVQDENSAAAFPFRNLAQIRGTVPLPATESNEMTTKSQSETALSRRLFLGLAGVTAVQAAEPKVSTPQYNTLTDEEEIALGRKFAASLEARLPVLEVAPLQQYVNSLVASLGRQSRRPNIPYYARVVNTADVNAVSLPGGRIYVFRGLLEAARNESELMSVLSHEVGHIVARHSANQLMLDFRARQVYELVRKNLELQNTVFEQILERIGGPLVVLARLKYGREQEFEADMLGLYNQVRSMSDPAGAVTFMRRLHLLSGGGGDWMESALSTHPNPAERARRLQAEIEIMDIERSVVRLDTVSFKAMKMGLNLLPAPVRPRTAK